MMAWDVSKRQGDLRIKVRRPTAANPKGAVIVDGPGSSGLEAWFGPVPDFPNEWIDFRDPVTAACMIQDGGTAGWIEDLKVSKSMRGKGLGTRILEAALKELHALGVDHVWLFVGPESDEWFAPLIRFYEQQGFNRAPDCGGSSKNVMMLKLDRVADQPRISGLEDIPMPPNIERPEMWTPESIVQAVKDGFTFMVPFIWGESIFSQNAYWIAGVQAGASGLTVGPHHTPEIEVIQPDSWIRAKTFFRPEMVPERAWLSPPNENGVVAVYLEIDPETIDWEQLNRGHQIRVRRDV